MDALEEEESIRAYWKAQTMARSGPSFPFSDASEETINKHAGNYELVIAGDYHSVSSFARFRQ